jgi:hypothetical protein
MTLKRRHPDRSAAVGGEKPSAAKPAGWLGDGRALLALFVIATAWHGLYFREPPGSDQGLFMAEADLLLHGSALYTDVWEHKPPGSIALYALALQLFGRAYLSIKLLNWLVALSVSGMLYVLGLRGGLSRAAATFGAALYLGFGAGPAFGGFWSVAQAEAFLDPLLCFALLLLQPAASRPLTVQRCFWAGAAIGTAIVSIKYSAAPWLALVLVCTRVERSARFKAPVSFVAGATTALLCLSGYFAATGRARSWFDATVLFNLDHLAVGASSLWDDPLGKVFPAPSTLLVFYAFALVAAISWARSKAGRADADWLKLSLCLWLLAFTQVLIQRKFWAYHYQVVLLPLAACAACGFERGASILARRVGERRAVLICVAAALLLSLGYARRCIRYIDQHALLDALPGRVPGERFYRSYTWGAHVYDYALDRMVSAHVESSTRSTDRILVWTFEPLIYFLSERKPATRFLFDYPLTQPDSALHAQHVRLLMQDIQAHPPALFLVRSDDRNSLEVQDSATQLAAIPVLADYVAAHYVAGWSAGDFVGLLRKPD